MALQVWLPLDGNLNNHGLAGDLSFTTISSNTTSNTAGKIGSCYQNNSNSGGGLLSNKTISLGTNQSMFCWFKFTSLMSDSSLGASLVSQHRYSSNCGMGITIRYVSSTTGYLSVNTGNGSSRTFNTYYGTTLLQANTWYHGGFTYDGSTIRIYVNGNLEKTQAYANMSVPADYLTVFCWSLSGTSGNGVLTSYKLNGSINDVRVYDHCLSPKEIKEISKGLILHYPLNNIINNNLISSLKSYAPASYCAYQFNLSENFVANQTYTFQFWDVNVSHTGKTDSQLGIAIYWGGGSVNLKTLNGTSYFTNGHADYLTFTITITSSNASGSGATNSWINIYNSVPNADGTRNMSIGAIKIEKGACATSYISNNISNIVYDESGYGHNGTKYGIQQAELNSPRYNYGTNYPDSACSIGIGNFSTMVPEGIFTFNIWFKKVTDEWSTKNYETIFGGPSGFELEAKNASTNSPSLVLWNWGKGSITYSLDVWNMVTFVRTTSGTKLYLNGVQGATGTAGSIPSGNYFIGSWSSSSSQNYRGYFSDARIYATELSDEDILELYNKPANIDNKGNMFSCEFDEEDTNKPQILKTGITNINNLLEFNDRLKVLNDGSVFLQIMHHNNPASNLFTTNNCWFYNDKNNLFSNLIMLKNCTWIKNLTTFEFLACEKLESSSTENQIRWSQTSNPALTSTATGYTLISGSPGRTVSLMNKGTNGAMHNGATWWCCCGSYTAYQGGIPGFCGVVKSGYIDLYIRIPDEMMKGNFENFVKFYRNSILSTQLIEK